MQRLALNLAVSALAAGQAVHVHRAVHFGDIAVLVLLATLALDDVRPVQAHLEAGVHALELLRRHFHEVLLLNVQFAPERDCVAAHFGVLRVIFDRQRERLVGIPVRQHHLERVQHRHHARRFFTQIVADAGIQQRGIHGGIRLAQADAADEIANRSGRAAAAAQTRQRGHTRVIPAFDVTAHDQRAQLALAHHGAGHVQAGELNLARTRRQHGLAVLHHPVIQRAVNFVFQRAEGVADALQRIANRVREVIHRVDAPLLTRAPVLLVEDAVHGGVAHNDVRRRHVNLGAQGVLSLSKFARAHPAEQVKALFGGTVAPRRILAGLGQRAAVFAHLLLVQLVHIRQAAPNPVLRDFVALIVIIRSVIQTARPVKTQPVNVVLDGFDKLGVFLRGVRIVKAQVALAAEFLRRQEVRNQRLAVANVHIAVGFGRKPRMHLRVATILQILFDGLPDKITASRCFFHRIVSSFSILYHFQRQKSASRQRGRIWK